MRTIAWRSPSIPKISNLITIEAILAPKSAIADRTLAIQINPTYANAYYNQAIDRSNFGDREGSIADFQKAAEIDRQQGKTQDYQDAIDALKAVQQP